MFVVIYTPGPAWQTGKAATEQSFFSLNGKLSLTAGVR
jgi:hypothetical protein